MKTGACCMGGTRRLLKPASSLLPAALLVLLPKCPLCLAAWLTLATGLSVPAGSAAVIRDLVLALSVAIAAFGAAQMVRRPSVRR